MSFLTKFQTIVEFYDKAYHMQKATFKSLRDYAQAYAEIEGNYSKALDELGKRVNDRLPQLVKEHKVIQSSVTFFANNLRSLSKTHSFFKQNVSIVSSVFDDLYKQCKEDKDAVMKALKDDSEKIHSKAREKILTDPAQVKSIQASIYRKLFNHLPVLSNQQQLRIENIKQNLITLASKIKSLIVNQSSAAERFYSNLGSINVKLNVPQYDRMQDQIIREHNCYASVEPLTKHATNLESSVQLNTLRESMRIKNNNSERHKAIEGLKVVLSHFRSKLEDELTLLKVPSKYEGIFNTELLPNWLDYSRELKTQTFKQLSSNLFTLFECERQDGDIISSTIQSRLGTSTYRAIGTFESLVQFRAISTRQVQHCLDFLQILTSIENQKATDKDLDALCTGKVQTNYNNERLSPNICLAMVSTLLDSIMTIKSNETVLVGEYSDYLSEFCEFAQKILSLDTNKVLLCLARRLLNILEITHNYSVERIELMYPMVEKNQMNDAQTASLCRTLLNNVSLALIKLFSTEIALENLLKISLLIEQIGVLEGFVMPQFIGEQLFLAGYNYVVRSEASKNLLNHDVAVQLVVSKHLSLLSQLLNELSLPQMYNKVFLPASQKVSALMGVGHKKLQSLLNKKFTAPIYEILAAHIFLIQHKDITNEQGEMITLGIYLSELEDYNQMPEALSDSYFNIFDSMRSATSNYTSILRNCAILEDWQERRVAYPTENCIDFCKCLFDLFDFLFKSSKRLAQFEQSKFVVKLSSSLMDRFYEGLSSELKVYLDFLSNSLQTAFSETTLEAEYRPKKIASNREGSKDLTEVKSPAKEKSSQVAKIMSRLINFKFLYDEFLDTVRQLLSNQQYEVLEKSGFFNKADLKGPFQSKMVEKICVTIEQCKKTEQNLVSTMGRKLVSPLLDEFFQELYKQEEVSGLEAFANKFSRVETKISQFNIRRLEGEIDSHLGKLQLECPEIYLKVIQKEITGNLLKAFKRQALNGYKFKRTFKKGEVVNELLEDSSYLIRIMLKRNFDESMVKESFEKPRDMLIKDLTSSTKQLMEKYFKQSLTKENDSSAEYYLLVLNLRIEDDEALDFVARFRKDNK